MSNRCRLRLLFPAVGLLLTLAPTARAQVSNLADFEEDFRSQTGPTATTDQGWFFDSRVFLTNTGDSTTATLTYPGAGSPVTLLPNGPALLEYGSPLYASQSALQAAFPLGTYTVVTHGGSQPSVSVSISDQSAPFPDVPIFTAGTFTGAQGLNAAQPFTFSWNAFNNPTSDAFVFFSVANAATGTTVFSGSFLSPATLSQTLPAGTLTQGVSYTASIDFSNRIDGTSNGIATFQGFDHITSFTFVAAPEPSSVAGLVVLSLGLALSVLRMRRRSGCA